MSMKNDLKRLKKYYLDFVTLPAWKYDNLNVRYKFIQLIKQLRKEKSISEKTFNNVYLHENKRGHVVMICGSYLVRLL